jgi:26S proteasome regulatory subunit N2
MRVLAWSPHLTPERAAAAGAEYISTKEELLCVSDIVSVHVVLGPTTEGLITASDFALMKSGALFINTARGPIVDEVALIDALKEKKIKGAALDVYDIEPLPLNHPLRKLDNVTLSPHLGYSTEEAMKVRM